MVTGGVRGGLQHGGRAAAARVLGYQEACGGCGFDEDREYVLIFEHEVLTGGYRYALPEDLLRLG